MEEHIKITGIYKITNISNNKVYIGESMNIYERWKVHKEDLKNNKHHSNKLQRDWNNYGENNFTFEIIKEINTIKQNIITQKLLLIAFEDIFIRQYDSIDNGYNVENTYEKVSKLEKEIFNNDIVSSKFNKNKIKYMLNSIQKNIKSK